MDKKSLHLESKRIAMGKFEVYLDAEYESSVQQTEMAVKELVKAKREWQSAINNYYRFLEIIEKQAYYPNTVAA